MLPGGEGGAHAGVRGDVVFRWCRRLYRRIFASSIVLAALLSSIANACTYLPKPSAETIFERSSTVFHGTAVKAEAFGPGHVFVRIWWKVDEVFKGKVPKGKSTITNYVCGGVFVLVGQPYVVSTDEIELGNPDPSDFGMIVDFGTRAAWTETLEHDRLVREFRRLSKRKQSN
jgi:hypothetical protein